MYDVGCAVAPEFCITTVLRKIILVCLRGHSAPVVHFNNEMCRAFFGKRTAFEHAAGRADQNNKEGTVLHSGHYAKIIFIKKQKQPFRGCSCLNEVSLFFNEFA